MNALAITGVKETGYVEKDERPVGAGEVRLKVDYVGFCGSDLNTYRGLNPLVKLPRVPGHETALLFRNVDEKPMRDGTLLAILRSKPQAGNVKLTVVAEGLGSQTVELETR